MRVLDYRAYMVFVGTYQNDAATIAEVERMRHRYKQLHRVEVPHDGPTCKADCLNWRGAGDPRITSSKPASSSRASCCTTARTCCIRSN